MQKLYNIIFPIWFILIMPPIVLLVLPSNFIIDSLVLIIGFKFLKLTKWFDNYKKTILRVWIVGFIVDIFGSLLLLATQFIINNDYLYENLVYPLAWNPFSKPLSLLYCLVVIILCGLLIYFINYKFSLNKSDLDKKSKRIISLMLGLITAPYLFLMPTSFFYSNINKSLENYQNTYIGDNSAVGNIISKINSSKYYDTFSLDTKSEPYGLIINYKNNSPKKFKYLEEDALILFNLIKNISYVEFKIDDTVYKFDSEYISSIYEDIKNKSISDIKERYDSKYFEEFTYLGHTLKYDLFDTSTSCSNDKAEIYKDSKYKYFVECSDINALYLVNGEYKLKLKTALEKKEAKIEDIFKTNLKINKVDINETNS